MQRLIKQNEIYEIDISCKKVQIMINEFKQFIQITGKIIDIHNAVEVGRYAKRLSSLDIFSKDNLSVNKYYLPLLNDIQQELLCFLLEANENDNLLDSLIFFLSDPKRSDQLIEHCDALTLRVDDLQKKLGKDNF